ncbi:hypothetical protein OQJ68_15160 [Microbulbifer thermotolerans]|uniref:N-acetyltransferase domain-containing protein n=1 Tax=Microbulbifer thermotolerans TaxID=252514 RepID=A0AB35I0H4_MICTH|nr:hypothetical protein [Microbulbifer thermotolerans]MCX2803131.1 hypothetical protein [Microbulbifer thermotolerans]
MSNQPTYKMVWGKHDELRDIALEVAYQQLPNILVNQRGEGILKSQISLRGLDHKTFEKLARWEESGRRIAEWDWREVRKKYRTHPKRFELSIWHNDIFLCGASIGRPTWSGNKLRLDFIEANPSGSPLSGTIADIVILSGKLYAKAIGASEIRIMNPVNDKVRNYYMSKGGFKFDSVGNFCFQEI